MPRKRKDDSNLFLASTAAIGSILINVAQAIENTKVEKVAGLLRGDRAKLLHVVGRLKKAYDVQNIKLAETQVALEEARREGLRSGEQARALQKKAVELEGTAEKRRQDYERAAADCARLAAENAQARSHLAQLETRMKQKEGTHRAGA